MKRLLKFGAALAVGAHTMIGCGDGKSTGPGNDGAYQQDSRNCSSQFVSDYNKVVIAIKYVYTMSDLDKAESLANDFGTKYRDVVCDAALTHEGRLDSSPTTLDANARVAEWKKLFSDARGPVPGSTASRTTPEASTAPIAPVIDPSRARPLSSLANGISLEIVDAEAFNRFANGGTSTLIQKGKGVSSGSYDAYTDLCYLDLSPTAVPYNQGDQVTLVLRVNAEKLSGVTLDAKLSMGCLRLSNRYESWKLSDLDAIFAGVAKVIAND